MKKKLLIILQIFMLVLIPVLPGICQCAKQPVAHDCCNGGNNDTQQCPDSSHSCFLSRPDIEVAISATKTQVVKDKLPTSTSFFKTAKTIYYVKQIIFVEHKPSQKANLKVLANINPRAPPQIHS